jgi:predicted nucleotidyltransferase component of viral defense system
MVMNINQEDLLYYTKSTGFRSEMLEKVIWLIELLNEIFSNTYLKQRLALKGGTALNLFHFGLPRLSVDIDLNYIGALEREVMLAEREELEAILVSLCQRLGLNVKRAPHEHAGGKWRLTYSSKIQSSGNLEIDLAYLYRIPLWPTTFQNSYQIGPYQAQQIPLLDIHELLAGKLSALMSRRAGRDLYDVYHLSSNLALNQQLDMSRLRLAFIVYGAMNRHDWRKIKIEDINFDAKELKNNLLPVLNQRSLETTLLNIF